ncbi:hypothetical protein QFC22_004590 [Naganishia vaughanmartiniae]|uniref:Uncharacterized protein n=1 Tax=Naganishia vaughanmartiniae TaxID=1424756 RepID=A0ACC2WZ58_9TREE|nr:hypothetical protein QFC22_004590 [Naganishia vaughanmartiniae]
MPIRKDAEYPATDIIPDIKPDVNAFENPAPITDVRAVTPTKTVNDETTHAAVKVKVEETKEEMSMNVKMEDQDLNELPDETQEYVKHETEPYPDVEPLEEWSRAIYNPARVIFLRQTPTKIYYTSILPPPTPLDNPELGQPSDGSTFRDPEIDRAYLVDFFNTKLTARFGSLKEVYARWAEQDALLFGRAVKARSVSLGVRVLRQDPWECLIEFITSSANNVPRITSLVHRLCYHFSPLLFTLPAPGYPTNGEMEGDIVPFTSYHLFPRPIDLLRHSAPAPQEAGTTDVDPKIVVDRLQQTLRDLGFGYRAGFISSSLQMLVTAHGSPEERGLLGLPRDMEDVQVDECGVEAFLMSLRRGCALDGDGGGLKSEGGKRWRTELLRLKGVGRKVADCIGLMSLDQQLQANIVPIDTHLQQIAARHPRFPAKLKAKATSTEGVYNAVQSFLCELWGGGPEAVSNTERARRPRMELAGWCQSVMFAADLKGSTAVVNVKVEASTQERTLLKVEPEGRQALFDSEPKPLDSKRRRRPTASQLETPDTASLVSDLLPDEKGSTLAQSKAADGSLRLKTEATSISGKRKRKSATNNATAKPKVTRTKGASKANAKPVPLFHETIVVTQSITPTNTAAADDLRQTSRRTERYASRCDKLEVDISTGP